MRRYETLRCRHCGAAVMRNFQQAYWYHTESGDESCGLVAKPAGVVTCSCGHKLYDHITNGEEPAACYFEATCHCTGYTPVESQLTEALHSISMIDYTRETK